MNQHLPEQPAPGLLRDGIDAFKANAIAAGLLWVVGTVIVGSYYAVPAVRESLNDVAAFKDRVGLIYPMISTAIFCGLIPFAMQLLQRGDRRNFAPAYLGLLLALWAYKGLEVELLYRGQAAMFGHDNRPITIAMKLMFDQFVYVPILAVPGMVLPLVWAREGYRWRRLRQRMRGNWYRRLILPVMVPNWLVWIPAVVLIYSLPTALQLVVQNVIACLWALMVMFITANEKRSPPA